MKKYETTDLTTGASADKITRKRNRSKALDAPNTQNNPPTSNKHRRRPKKRAHLNDTTSNNSSSDTKPKNDPLTFLPLELLGEILVGTRSTREILSVARCSKHLWKTLTGSAADFIWKRTRQAAYPEPLPDPPHQLSEPAYAVMIFAGGLCEICGHYTKLSYLSFALKLRICQKDNCQAMKPARQFFKRLSIDQEHIKARTPTIEVDNPVFDKGLKPQNKNYWPTAAAWCRTKEWIKSVRDSNPSEGEIQGNEELAAWCRTKEWVKSARDSNTSEAEIQGNEEKQQEEAVKKNKEWMEFCVALRKWKEAYDKKFLANKKSNEGSFHEIARANKLNSHDLAFTSFGALHRIRNKCLEPLKDEDFDALAATVKEELGALAGRRQLSQQCASYRTVWEAVQTHYQQLISEGSKVVLPPFSTFRRLPTLASLLTITKSDTSKSIQNILKKQGLKEVINKELRQWESSARRDMAALLGYPDWSPGSEGTKVLHPVDRAIARFLCKACTEYARKYEREIESLTFAKACSHECPREVDAEKEGFMPWDASTFVKDDKAVAAIARALEVNGIDEARTNWEMLSDREIKCTSCKPFSFMTFDILAVHCHRHEDMTIALRKEEEMGALLKHLMTFLSEEKPGTARAKKLIMRKGDESDLKDCGCKHCLFAEALKSPDKDAKALFKGMRKMSVNGLRSHLKAKHGYSSLGDEDVFIFPKSNDES